MARTGGAVRHRAMRQAMRAGPSDTRVGAHPVTLCRFDSKPTGQPKIGPFIPCERRLAIWEILEIQGRAFGTSF